MEAPGFEPQLSNEADVYLQPGPQTEITPAVLEIAKNIHGDTREKVGQLLAYTKGMKFDAEKKPEIFRRRVATEIIESGKVTGCTDAALAFVAIARAVDVPAIYVETIHRSWLEGIDRRISGHIYARVYERKSGSWLTVDPIRGKLLEALPEGEVIYKEGKDSWDIGIHSSRELREQFERFKADWVKGNVQAN